MNNPVGSETYSVSATATEATGITGGGIGEG